MASGKKIVGSIAALFVVSSLLSQCSDADETKSTETTTVRETATVTTTASETVQSSTLNQAPESTAPVEFEEPTLDPQVSPAEAAKEVVDVNGEADSDADGGVHGFVAPAPVIQQQSINNGGGESAGGDGGAASYYPNCAAARAAGAAPLYAGQPGYSSNLDRDGDGVACE